MIHCWTDEDPLEYFMGEYGFDQEKIEKFVTGMKYSAVMLKNGDIGVCANLGVSVDVRGKNALVPDLNNRASRIIYNAYLNALLNSRVSGMENTDICEAIDFGNVEHVTMIGYFKPVIDRLTNEGIDLKVFDLIKSEAGVIPDEEKSRYLSTSEAIILTSTSVSNGTFLEIMRQISGDSHVYLLGPSSIMHPFFTVYGQLRMIFGTGFFNRDERVLHVIEQGGGTRDFQKFGVKKVLNLDT
ncbi:MAG TPA: DUF364 domain-containing protein [Bacteroidales bacterium]|nr:DUF364 domain-containing protein [Bacteroidales bacterium]HNS45735.1 DUF364 domain-containing protein [Bacteroidales bacterium]